MEWFKGVRFWERPLGHESDMSRLKRLKLQMNSWARIRSQIQYWRDREGAPSTFEIGESSSAAARILPVTGEIVEETIPLLVVRLRCHDGVIDHVCDQLEEMPPERVTMPTTRQGMSSEEIEQIVAQRVTNAIETVAIYKTKTHHNKRQKGHESTGPFYKKGYARKLHLCNKCKLHHTGPCTVKCNNCKRVGYMTRDCRTPVPATTQRPSVAKQKPIVTNFRCGSQGHFKRKCPRLKNQNRCNHKGKKGKAREDPNVVTDNANA
ncbi:reverse transcriptase domain-containing protein [Tanacetum coccineum]